MTKAPTSQQRLTFAQREFGAALPQQMKRGELTRALRVQLFATTRNHVAIQETVGEPDRVVEPWYDLLYDVHVEHLERMPDEFDDDWLDQDATLRQVFEKGTAVQVYGFLEFILRHPSCPNNFAAAINAVLVKAQAAFRIVDGDTLAPFASEEEAATVIAAVAELGEPQFVGAKDHYKKAVSALSSADYAASMRESIHAVESVTKALTGESTVQKGVKALASKGHLHVTLSDALEKVAAWTNCYFVTCPWMASARTEFWSVSNRWHAAEQDRPPSAEAYAPEIKYDGQTGCWFFHLSRFKRGSWRVISRTMRGGSSHKPSAPLQATGFLSAVTFANTHP